MAIEFVAAEGYDEKGYCPIYDFPLYEAGNENVWDQVVDFLDIRLQYMVYGKECCEAHPFIFDVLKTSSSSFPLKVCLMLCQMAPIGKHIQCYDFLNWRQIIAPLLVDENLHFSLYGDYSNNFKLIQDDEYLVVIQKTPKRVNVSIFKKSLAKPILHTVHN